MNRALRGAAVAAWLAVATAAYAADGEKADASEPKVSGSVTGFYYAMRDQSDFGVGVAAINRGPLHLEARYNYESRDAGSLFAGWNFSGGDTVTFQITPIIGGLVGAERGLIPGVEASVASGPIDVYIEAEYVAFRDHHEDRYYYAWSELGWKPVEWLRLGLVGQRSRVVHTDRDLQRGLFVQAIAGRMTLGVYAFNPDSGDRYVIGALGVQF
ncbi:MAG TPA: hypothetical protein VFF44_04905 [Casimicrobiaceae bacterium]|nr:hypothetical protein [Casimicrobiaceae bacterium]